MNNFKVLSCALLSAILSCGAFSSEENNVPVVNVDEAAVDALDALDDLDMLQNVNFVDIGTQLSLDLNELFHSIGLDPNGLFHPKMQAVIFDGYDIKVDYIDEFDLQCSFEARNSIQQEFVSLLGHNSIIAYLCNMTRLFYVSTMIDQFGCACYLPREMADGDGNTTIVAPSFQSDYWDENGNFNRDLFLEHMNEVIPGTFDNEIFDNEIAEGGAFVPNNGHHFVPEGLCNSLRECLEYIQLHMGNVIETIGGNENLLVYFLNSIDEVYFRSRGYLTDGSPRSPLFDEEGRRDIVSFSSNYITNYFLKQVKFAFRMFFHCLD